MELYLQFPTRLHGVDKENFTRVSQPLIYGMKYYYYYYYYYIFPQPIYVYGMGLPTQHFIYIFVATYVVFVLFFRICVVYYPFLFLHITNHLTVDSACQ